MALRANDMQTAQFAHFLRVFRGGRVAAKDDVYAAAGHVGGDGHGSGLAGLSNDGRFLFMILGVEQVMRHAFARQHAGQQLVLLNGNRAHQHRLPLGMALFNFPHNGCKLARFGFINTIGFIDALRGLVRRNH